VAFFHDADPGAAGLGREAIVHGSQKRARLSQSEAETKHKHTRIIHVLIATLDAVPTLAQSPKYPPLSEYMMARDAEIALAKSAAPDYVFDHATIKVFTAPGFQTVHEGDNGFVCVVMRGFTGASMYTPVQVRDYINYDAKTRNPICLDPLAARTVLPYYEIRTKLGLEPNTPKTLFHPSATTISSPVLAGKTMIVGAITESPNPATVPHLFTQFSERNSGSFFVGVKLDRGFDISLASQTVVANPFLENGGGVRNLRVASLPITLPCGRIIS